MEQAEEALRRIVDFLARLETADAVTAATPKDRGSRGHARARRSARRSSSDLNTAAALAAVFDLVRDVQRAIDAQRDERGRRDGSCDEAIEEFDRVLGVIALRRAEDAQPPMPVEEIERLIDERKAARQRRDFARADDIRQVARRARHPARRQSRPARAGRRNERTARP